MMNKVIIVLSAVLAVSAVLVHGQDQVDNYVNLNVDQYQRIVDGYDTELENFVKYYEGRVETAGVLKEMLVTSIVQTEERFTPMLLLNGKTKECVLKYYGRIARVEEIKENITKCALVATTQLKPLLVKATTIRNALLQNIAKYREEVFQCNENDFFSCISAVTLKANKFAAENQKDFDYELEAADCLAKANVKKTLDCTYSIHSDTLFKIGEVDALIGKCFVGEEECKPCQKYTCEYAVDVKGNFQNKTTDNPFYGRTDSPSCLMLKVK